MAKVIINPGTPDFNRFLTARNGAVIRGFDDVSIAISSLFKTVDAVKHPDLVQAIQDWFNELHEENKLSSTRMTHSCHQLSLYLSVLNQYNSTSITTTP
ncbi:hypothetical protein [Klebsiella quasipneumoniae]|uniref:hypothetical protein n=1 Tax=Klebsiella quasipneumoniae TaxID=1463165 RepID=UPI002209BC4C|nr:hypothetical protein [Klebsiella quasipneumoniae]BDO05916.1 hypothetical protein KAM622c_55030 [Klebsiella quasipneumoniae subsp. quasipneumoniae]